MMHKRQTLRIFIISVLILLGSFNAIAQEVVFYLQAGADKMGIEDQMNIQYTIKNVSGVNSVTPDKSIHDNFNILGGPYSSTSSNISVINGNMTRSMSLSITYVVQPKKKGTLTIPEAIAVDASGTKYKSNSLKVEVVDGSIARQQQQQRQQYYDDPFEALRQQRQRQLEALRQRQQQLRQQQGQQQQQGNNEIASQEDLDKNLFIKVTVDKNDVYVGEQITATYKLYARIPMNASISKLPSLNGFWTQDFDIPTGRDVKPVTEMYDGKEYQVFTLKKSALFPQQTGTLELDAAEADGVARIIQKSQGRDPFFDEAFGSLFMDDPFFNDAFFGGSVYKDVKVKLKSKPVKINVRPLPIEGQQENYGGAVGDFTISQSIDKTEITTDGVTNLKLEIEGSGNLKLIEAPQLSLPNGLSSYEPQILDTITSRSTTIKGKKIITYTITPEIPGSYKIPGVVFSYFDTKSNEYITDTTEPTIITVTAGKNYTAPVVATKSYITDLHNNTTEELDDTKKGRPLLTSVGYWSLHAVPVLAFIGVILWRRREDELSQNTLFHRSKRANKVALKRLVTAKKLMEEQKRTAFYEEVSKAIWLYLSDKLHIPLSSLSKDNVFDVLNKYKIDTTLQQDVDNIINECETSLYSGSNTNNDMQNAYQKAVTVISKLEESFKA
ncbi:MAG: BatD family protein [Flavipsychrobacter sp.]